MIQIKSVQLKKICYVQNKSKWQNSIQIKSKQSLMNMRQIDKRQHVFAPQKSKSAYKSKTSTNSLSVSKKSIILTRCWCLIDFIMSTSFSNSLLCTPAFFIFFKATFSWECLSSALKTVAKFPFPTSFKLSNLSIVLLENLENGIMKFFFFFIYKKQKMKSTRKINKKRVKTKKEKGKNKFMCIF